MRLLDKQLRSLRIVPVVSLPSVSAGVKLAEILVRCHLPVAEITFRTEAACSGIAEMKNQFPELLLLAGTVLTSKQAKLAQSAGAEGLVSPGFDSDLVAYCYDNNMPIYPGVATASEVMAAIRSGLTTLKFFPAELNGGMNMVRSLLSVFRNISLMPTGGITPGNVLSYLSHERVICCGGTWLAPESMMEDNKWETIESRIQDALKLLNEK
ncbi:MAG: bifunctional 4-hydroxy-2-oxoglutarate aldolase/2-dehydro-3-deoxy-phosphogluconate aldolase [Desulfobacterales bacterium]|nr:bifunctional 4-hydroxy-2-oxoglutarate aldolase/2-dehydro-3-deoxy-phosphogluconate aldolase [Deltaproteobacteria bacterium]NNK93103.1 bifunctional 4-hydroxy-2-oxoglutarate aldolase/2-dehydro-3-deoxy-phosphogluconate aldolase [Desulfobacterales bacterium]